MPTLSRFTYFLTTLFTTVSLLGGCSKWIDEIMNDHADKQSDQQSPPTKSAKEINNEQGLPDMDFGNYKGDQAPNNWVNKTPEEMQRILGEPGEIQKDPVKHELCQDKKHRCEMRRYKDEAGEVDITYIDGKVFNVLTSVINPDGSGYSTSYDK